MKGYSILNWMVRIIAAAMWLTAGLPKLLNPADFALDILNYRVGGMAIALLGALMVPFWEILLGILLITGKYLKAAWWSSLVLMLFFDALILQAYLRGLQIDCGCFGGVVEQMIGPEKFFENIILTMLVLLGLLLAYKKKAQPKN